VLYSPIYGLGSGKDSPGLCRWDVARKVVKHNCYPPRPPQTPGHVAICLMQGIELSLPYLQDMNVIRMAYSIYTARSEHDEYTHPII